MTERQGPKRSSSSAGRKPAPRRGSAGRKRTSGAESGAYKRAGGVKSGGKRAGGGGRDKRTSRNTDDRNPTKSGTQYPPKKYRSAEEEAPVEPRRSSLRKVDRGRAETASRQPRQQRRGQVPVPRRRRNIKTTEASEELARIAGRNAKGAQQQLARAAEAFTAGRERDAARLLRPLRDAYPDAGAVRELLGLCNYRLGNYGAAARELEAFVELTDSVEQHPVLMDCMRALGKYKRVDELWEELANSSPSNALVIEGRIVAAGARADRGRVREAIGLLERRAADVKRVQEHNLRLWYALADLYERAGEVAHARDLFARVRRYDSSFADVAERCAALG